MESLFSSFYFSFQIDNVWWLTDLFGEVEPLVIHLALFYYKFFSFTIWEQFFILNNPYFF